jgi:prepilin-type N-terminal cleavage/methylation domain-containing protein/prepilin-type processing-associated H-X9-DG protein
MSAYSNSSICSQRRGGFTLVELLVVISIISMLMSILLPNLIAAREMGHRIVCQANMRSLTFAWNAYTIEYNDRLCSPDTLYNNDGEIDYNWVADGPDDPANTIGGTEQAIKDGVLAPLLSDTTGVYKCKSDSTDLLRSYSISNVMGGYTCGCGNMTRPYYSMGQIKDPAGKLVFIDADSVLPAGEPKWIQRGFWPVDRDARTWVIAQENNITARHGDGTNLTFADNHCEYRRWKDPRTIAIANWDFSTANMDGDNKDLDYLLLILRGPYD